MQSNWAAEHLLVIRTLMERSAIYRRALAPIVLSLGVLGILGAVAGGLLRIETGSRFVLYWSVIGLVGVTGAYLMARLQALKMAEAFWSAPTRRVTQALLPPLFVGLAASVVGVVFVDSRSWPAWWLVALWTGLYGCALHAAGFFMPRGIKLFGWGFIVIGSLLAAWLVLCGATSPLSQAHAFMGVSFGGLHLAYGVYLYFTERRKNEP